MPFGFVACGPDEVLIVSGLGNGGLPTLHVGGSTFVLPIVHKVQRMPLSTLTLNIESPRVFTAQGVQISVSGVAQVKINGQNEEMLRAAAEQFGSKSTDEIIFVARETLEGHQRAIISSMQVEEIIRDRKKFSDRVFEEASTNLVNMGIVIISYTIKDIADDVGYLHALGKARTTEVQRDARIGEAEARMDANIQEAKAKMEEMEAQLANQTEVARAKRDFDTKKAVYDTEVNTAKAEAELAYKLQAAKIQQQIQEQETEVKVVERKQEIEIAQQEIMRKEKELESKIRKPAEAEKFRLETIAEANRQKAVLEAQATAEALAIKGEAEAFAIEAKAKAEAEQMSKKADALMEYEKAALVDMVLKALPKVAAEISAPIANANKITMVSDGSGAVGASRLADEVMTIMTRVPDMVKTMTGVDLNSSLNASLDIRQN